LLYALSQLVYKCPTWSWEAGDPSKAKSYLPLDKQYLATRGVPCHRRVATLETDYLGETELEGVAAADGEEASDGWIEPQVLLHKANETEVELGDDDEQQHHSEMHSATAADGSSSTATSDLAAAMGAAQLNDDHFQTRRQSPPPSSSSGTTTAAAAGSADAAALGAGSSSNSAANDDYPDLDTFVENSVAEADSATLAPLQQHLGSYLTAEEPADSIVHTRSYDLSITYDKYYQVPRIWLAGRDEGGSPLPPAAIFEDIMQVRDSTVNSTL
jgi:ubiquitin-like-conjugating enzyme ATG3